MELIQDTVSKFTTTASQFQLPSRLSLSRYIRAYIDGFHKHLPFLHISSLNFDATSLELVLAMAAVGTQYCFEAERGVELFHMAKAIAIERICARDSKLASTQPAPGSDASCRSSELVAKKTKSRDRDDCYDKRQLRNGPLGILSSSDCPSRSNVPEDDLIQSAQALLILMAMATWTTRTELLREALAIQSILASLVRDDGLSISKLPSSLLGPRSWEEWVRRESATRTKYVVFCFFNLHCIVYDIPPLILNSELNMHLPCSEAEFNAEDEKSWQEVRPIAQKPQRFQNALRSLFVRGAPDVTTCHSSLGNYVLIQAIIQHLFFVRQMAKFRSESPELPFDDAMPVEEALRKWQSGWNQSPESSIDPKDPNGPVSFNSTALLRLAYIRLHMDTGPGRALGTRNPWQIAHALRAMPTVKRTSSVFLALLHSAHALSIPVKIGVRLVAKTQSFIWSIQHALCSLECAILLSKWFEEVSNSTRCTDSAITENERLVLNTVRTLLDETEPGATPKGSAELVDTARYLSVEELRVWASIFRGNQTWAIVDVIGTSLDIYANMLEAD